MGHSFDRNEMFERLYSIALTGEDDCGGMISFNYFSGEPVTGFTDGCPMFIRDAKSSFNLANFMRMHLCSALATLKYGLDILTKEENVSVKKMFGHGGFFKTKVSGQMIASAAIGSPVCVMETAGEGGAWGIALLALFMIDNGGKKLPEYLNDVIFAGAKGEALQADEKAVEGFNRFMKKYIALLDCEKAAVEVYTK